MTTKEVEELVLKAHREEITPIVDDLASMVASCISSAFQAGINVGIELGKKLNQ